MRHRTRHRSRQTAERHLQRQGFTRQLLTGCRQHWGKRLQAQITLNVAPYLVEVVYRDLEKKGH